MEKAHVFMVDRSIDQALKIVILGEKMTRYETNPNSETDKSVTINADSTDFTNTQVRVREKTPFYTNNKIDSSSEDKAGPPGYDSEERQLDKADFIKTDRLYSNIAEATKSCQKIYFIYLSFLSYAFLTVVTTSDLNFVFNESVELPIIKTNIPGNLFFILTPILLIGLFSYIQLYLIKIDDLIKFTARHCREVYKQKKQECDQDPKCEKINDKDSVRCYLCELQSHYLYPWILIMSRYPPKKTGNQLERFERIVKVSQKIFVQISVWYLLPVVLATFSLFAIKNHNLISFILFIVSALGTLIVYYFWIKNHPTEERIRRIIFSCLFFAFSIFLVLLNVKANQGVFFLHDPQEKRNQWQTELNFIESILRHAIFVDLSYQKLVKEPDIREKYKAIYWATFENMRLEGARLSYSILPYTNFKNAQLKSAFISGAVLENADFLEANLESADLSSAILKKAKLQKANLKNTDLVEADLRKADLSDANLTGSNLIDSKLAGATFLRADFLMADFRGADFFTTDNDSEGNKSEVEICNQIKEARNWCFAYYSDKIINILKFEPDHNDRLKEKDFRDYNFQKANLGKADLRNSNLERANLQSTDLIKANLQEAVLKQTDLREANLQMANLWGAKLLDAKLDNANILYADLQNVTGLTAQQIKKATNWQLAYYSNELRRNLGLSKNHNNLVKQKNFKDFDLTNINLEDVDLSGAVLERAVLKGGNLKNANLIGANLNSTNFQGADLSNVVVTDSIQLSNVLTLYGAKLDDNLLVELESKYPNLFVEPKKKADITLRTGHGEGDESR